MISAVFIVIVLVVNMIVGFLFHPYIQKWMSVLRNFTVSLMIQRTFLKKLDKDVTIYQVVQSGSEDETIKKLLEKYRRIRSY